MNEFTNIENINTKKYYKYDFKNLEKIQENYNQIIEKYKYGITNDLNDNNFLDFNCNNLVNNKYSECNNETYILLYNDTYNIDIENIIEDYNMKYISDGCSLKYYLCLTNRKKWESYPIISSSYWNNFIKKNDNYYYSINERFISGKIYSINNKNTIPYEKIYKKDMKSYLIFAKSIVNNNIFLTDCYFLNSL